MVGFIVGGMTEKILGQSKTGLAHEVCEGGLLVMNIRHVISLILVNYYKIIIPVTF